MTSAALYKTDSPARLPSSVIFSLALHVGGLGLWLFSLKEAKHQSVVMSDVDIIRVHKANAAQAAQQATKPKLSNTFDFLKMALPSAQHAAAPQMAQIKLPETHKAMTVEAPKLHDRGHLDSGPKLDMDLEHHDNMDIAKVEARIPSRKLSAMAAMPKLEEVGRRQVRNLPAALAMEERRQEAQSLQGMDALAKTEPRHRAGMAQVAALPDAAPAPDRGSRFSSKIAALLPEEAAPAKAAVMPAPIMKQGMETTVHERKKPAGLQSTASKKGVEIEGPLADRKVLNYEIPEFPQWAKDQGVLDAEVAIRFWVDKNGDVLPNMRVEHTSGYGRMDKLAMDALSRWKFAPLMQEEKQWGVITFKFILE